MLTPLKNYNNIPDRMLPEVPPPGTVVAYRYLRGVQDYQIDAQGVSTQPIIYPSFKLDAISSTYDNDARKTIRLAMATGDDASGNILSDTFMREVLRMRPNKDGLVFLTLGSPEMDALFAYIELGPYLDGSPGAGNGGRVVFERVDYEAEAKAEIDEIDLMMEAIASAKTLSDDDVLNAALVLGINAGNRPATVVRPEVISFARKLPAEYKQRVETPKFAGASTMRYALSNRMVEIEANQKVMRWADGQDGGNIMNLVRTDTESAINEWLAYADRNATLKEAVDVAVAEHKAEAKKTTEPKPSIKLDKKAGGK